MCFLLFQTPPRNPELLFVCSPLCRLDAPLLPGGPPWLFHMKVWRSLLVVLDRFGPCVVVGGLSKDRPVTCWPCNPVSHADTVWIFPQSCMFPCCNLVTHHLVKRCRQTQGMHTTKDALDTCRQDTKKTITHARTHTATAATTTTGGGPFYFRAEFRHLRQSWLIRPLLARLRLGH